uniref:S haplotype-specific F-box protein 27 n=2 Tax=Prunus TaxID=3754 RepID=A0A4D6RFJ2_PRUDU|nr:S haplotype-specific F-box protein 27 [Prunus dulcis]
MTFALRKKEILIDILVRLPAKSLVRFLCTCKSWSDLIGSSSFVSTHLHRNVTGHAHAYLLCLHHPNFECQRDDDDRYFKEELQWSLFSNVTFEESSKLSHPLGSTEHYVIYGSSNGLVCISDEILNFDSPIHIWNPSVKKLRTTSMSTNKEHEIWPCCSAIRVPPRGLSLQGCKDDAYQQKCLGGGGLWSQNRLLEDGSSNSSLVKMHLAASLGYIFLWSSIPHHSERSYIQRYIILFRQWRIRRIHSTRYYLHFMGFMYWRLQGTNLLSSLVLFLCGGRHGQNLLMGSARKTVETIVSFCLSFQLLLWYNRDLYREKTPNAKKRGHWGSTRSAFVWLRLQANSTSSRNRNLIGHHEIWRNRIFVFTFLHRKFGFTQYLLNTY